MDIYSILASKPHNPHYLNRYYKFILTCKEENVKRRINKRTKKNPDGVYMESHHICPSAVFPDYNKFSKNKWNKIDLTAKQHFIAHLILWRVYGGSQTDAYFRMSQHKKYGYHKGSRLYEILKNEFSLSMSGEGNPMYGLKRPEISEALKGEGNPMYGKHHTDEFKIRKSIMMSKENHPDWGKKKPDHSLKMSGSNNPACDKTIRKWYHKEHGVFIGINYDFRNLYDLDTRKLSKISKGLIENFHKGWILISTFSP